ncbi:GIY-YIG nuclease family protein [Bradyrhizobium elkanii]|uniref:GIY-YIG nuclease family protein n=1 Tax=Bradyrhizobium elkanii TaxID=29448 RepID=UPI0021685040|nr:GIY-YIG nuclease family protein [Bradyrhizobium elkanii]MCS3690993.1 hypothetical protein [Bradyrhizobium elkanii]
MPRPSLGPRLWFDESRQEWVIRDLGKFIRTGAGGWRKAQDMLAEYLNTYRAPAQEPPLGLQIDGFVYFMTADCPDFPIKIGFTRKDNGRRQRLLQVGCPYALILLGRFAGRQGDERRLHRRFASQRLQGEWFARTPDLLNLIKEKQQ